MTFGEYLGAGSGVTKGLWRLNGNSNDSSGNSANGTASNISYVDGRFGQAASFNGTNSVITYPSISLNANSITVSARAKLEQLKNQVLIDTGWFLGANSYLILLALNGTVSAGVRTSSTVNEPSKANGYSTGVRINFLFTSNGTNTILYLNGVNEASVSNTVSSTMTGTGAIGKQQNLSSAFLDGLVDEVIIENRGWTPVEVKKYYTMTKGRFGIL